MKRWFCAVLAALLACASAVGAGAEARFVFSDLTLEELYAVREQLEACIVQAETADGEHVYESGAYLVGSDIPSGDYVLVENEDALFASVIVRQDASEEAALVTHHLINRQAVIHLTANTWLTLSEARACPLKQADAADLASSADEGGYLVGAQLAPGRYTVKPTDKAPLSSYSVYDGILGTGAQLTKFEKLNNGVEIELAEGEYIELTGCKLNAVP